MTVLACASHLLVDLPLFGGPVVMVIAAVVLMTRSERKRTRRAPQAPSAGA